MQRWMMCVLLAGGCTRTALELHAGDDRTLGDVNGSVSCDRATLYLPANALINGDLDATYCVLKIVGTVNGAITAHGGIVHVIGADTINGELSVDGAHEVIASNSSFNGGLDVESSETVRILASDFNGDGVLANNASVDVEDTFFNGDIDIHGNALCAVADNSLNGTRSESGCTPIR